MAKAKIVQLVNIDTREKEYPVVLTPGIFNLEGVDIETIINNTKGNLEDTIQDSLFEKIVPEGFVDLGLPSGILWATNDLNDGTEYLLREAVDACAAINSNCYLPSSENFKELVNNTNIEFSFDASGNVDKITFTSKRNNSTFIELSNFDTVTSGGFPAHFSRFISDTLDEGQDPVTYASVIGIKDTLTQDTEGIDNPKEILSALHNYTIVPINKSIIRPIIKDAESKAIYVRQDDFDEFKEDNQEILDNKIHDIQQKTLTTNYDTDSADKYTLKRESGDSDIQLKFTPISPLTLHVPRNIGDIRRGTLSQALNGMPLSQILDHIIFKTIYPTITEPEVNIKGSVITLQEPTNSIWDGYSYDFYKGSVVVDDGVTEAQAYVGDPISASYQVDYIPGPTSEDYPIVATGTMATAITGGAPNSITRYEVGTYQYRVTVTYGVGPIMKDSKGATDNPIKTSTGEFVENPHPSSTITSEYGCTMKFSLPVWIDDASGTYVKQTLQPWDSMVFSGVQMQDTSPLYPIKIKTPRKLKSIMSFNSISDRYDGNQLDNFEVKEVVENINNVSYRYFEYIYKGPAINAIKFEVITK